MKKFSLIASAFLLGSFFIGCGGGSSSSTSTTTETVTVEGTVVDDLIANGIVDIYDQSGNLLKTVRTDENGTYTANLTNYQGVVITKVYCDENSKFVESNETCDINSSFPLQSANIVKDQTKVAVNVSPVSTVMVALAEQNGGINENTIKESKIKTAYMFGIDPVEVQPTEGIYNQIIEAFHKIANENNQSVVEITKELISDMNDNIVGDDTNITKELAQELNQTIETNWTKNGGELNLTEINTSVPYDSITATKAIFQSLRDQINSITNEDENGTIDSEIKKADEQLKDITFDNLDIAAKSVGAIVDAIINGNNESSFVYNDVNYSVTIDNDSYTISDTHNSWNGTLSYQNIPEDVNVSTDSFNASLVINGNLPTENNENQTIDSNVKLDYVKNTSLSLTIDKIEVNDNKKDLIVKNINAKAILNGFDKEGNLLLNHFEFGNAEIYGKAGDFEINGSLSLSDYVVNTELANKTGDNAVYYTYEINYAAIACKGDSDWNYTEYNASSIQFNATGTTLTIPLYNAWWDNNIKLTDYLEFDSKNELEDENGSTYNYLKNAFILDPNACPTGYIPVVEWLSFDSNENFTNSGYLPSKLEFIGSIKDINTSVELNGKITAEGTNLATVQDNEVVTGSISASVELKRPGFKTITINANYSSNIDNDKVEINYLNDNNVWISLNAIFNYEENTKHLKNGEVKITSSDGLSATLPINEEGNIVGEVPVYYNGEKVGIIVEDNDAGFIKYEDGTFESFK
ncbi:hypothetical protein FE773_00285 [Caminibacter mediatlanticus TB-2]|uniref:Carboxypeptidase regulatory-like domain-containing protein n=1 Tax=Caminibacter mediatlanticus TB-2 TaxID=391592 RepID=A0ABX5V5X4_9BACT|nr:hypothetical protein [Caminibacter mediatlanticus]QCT93680.1 hypothetical protein FE773_00285 [Caminibacter mediatlanticus TB-2]